MVMICIAGQPVGSDVYNTSTSVIVRPLISHSYLNMVSLLKGKHKIRFSAIYVYYIVY